MGLLSEVQARDDLTIPVEARHLEVVEKPPSLGDEAKQASAGMVILDVGLEVLGKITDSLGDKGDLDFGRAGVGLVGFKLADELGLFFAVERHRKRGLRRMIRRSGFVYSTLAAEYRHG
jgi:hypothetical protein